jgi:plasmid stability protein
MPAITVRNISVETHRALKARAKARGTSAEAEVRAILDAAARPEQGDGLGTRLHKIFRSSGYSLPEIKRDKSPIEPASFD